MEKIVVDTSVAVKWYVEELGTEEAVGLLTDYQEGKVRLLAPQIIGLELANALFYGAKFNEDDLSQALKAFYALKLTLFPLSDHFIQGAARFMVKLNIAIYDALFICLAESEKIPLLTADKKHHQKKFSKFIEYL